MTNRQLSRRTVLKTGAGAVAAGTMAGLAGCSGLGIFGGGNESANAIGDWAFEPGEIGDGDYYVNFTDLQAVLDHEDELDDELFDDFEGSYVNRYEDNLGIDIEDADWRLSFSFGQFDVVTADHDVDSAVDEAEDNLGYEEADEFEGYTLVVDPNGRGGVAVDGSTVLWISRVEDAEDGLETFIETQTGDTDLYVDDDEDFAEAVDAVGGDLHNASLSNNDSPLVARSSGVSMNGDTCDLEAAYVYEESDDFEQGELEARAEGYEDLDDVSTSKNGRVGTIEGTIDTDDLYN